MNIGKKSLYKILLAISLLSTSSISVFAGGTIYIPMGGDNKIIIVEEENSEILGTIEGLASVHGLAATPNGDILIAASYEEREMTDGAPPKPEGVSAADHALHHPAQGGSAKPKINMGDMISTISIIDSSSNKIIRSIDVPGAVHHVAISDNGKYGVVTHSGSGAVSIIDLETYDLVANLATGDMPNYAQFSPDSSKLYVSNAGNNTISIIDTNNWIVERNIIVGEGPEHMVLANDGSMLFVNNVGEDSVSFISLEEAKIVSTIKLTGTLHGLDISDDGKSLYVAVRGADSLVQIDIESAKQIAGVNFSTPYHVTNIKGNNRLYVSSADEPKVFVIDANSLAIVNEIEVGARAHQMVRIKR